MTVCVLIMGQISTLEAVFADAVFKAHVLVSSCIAAMAVASLHAIGFGHQDLKPANDFSRGPALTR